jgi:DNA helicase HerA-like ATPase
VTAPDHPNYRGLVLGTEDAASTPLSFSAWIAPDRYVQLDDVVHVRTTLPGGEYVDTYGVVDELQATQEGVSFTSDVALSIDGVLPTQSTVSAHVSVTRVEPEIYVPPMPGQPVYLAVDEERDRALFFDRMCSDDADLRFPVGVDRVNRPVYGNLEFLDGARGAHVNISGVSGVATKTTYATFLLYGLFEGQALGPRRSTAKALIFNVKGEDLLFLDQPNARLTEEQRDRYAALGLPAGPFGSVAFFSPCQPGAQPLPQTSSRMEGVTGFYWTLHDFCLNGFVRYLFADADRDSGQIGDLVEVVAARLKRAAETTPFRDPEGNVEIEGVTCATLDDMVQQVERNLVGDEDDDDPHGRWMASTFRAAAPGTVRAFLRRLEAGARLVAPFVRGAGFADPRQHRIRFDEQVTVVDLHRLHDRAQRFVVGVLLSRVMEEHESSGGAERPAPFFVVVDELNKYAPREGRSPIKETLLDIAERGRSLGVILIGAQQTASEVEQRIVANASYRVVGRLDTAEASREQYRFLTPSARARAVLLKPGSMIVSQPEIPVPLLVEFPFPSWATRRSEVAPIAAGSAADPLRRFDMADDGYDL